MRPSFGYARFCYICGVGIRSCPANLVPWAGLVRVSMSLLGAFWVPRPFGFFLPVILSGVRLGQERIPMPLRGFLWPSAAPRLSEYPIKNPPTRVRFGSGPAACALTPRIGAPERMHARPGGTQLQGQFSHPWGTPGRGYDPRWGHHGLADAPNLHTGAQTCTSRSDGVWGVPGLNAIARAIEDG